MILLKEAIVRETGVLTAESKTKLITNSKKLITTIVADYLMTPLVARDMKLWKYITAKSKDDVGISTIVVDGKPCTDAKSKAEALNSYFKSVFTKEVTKSSH